jgi:uncharacterized membrane protein YhhN
VTVLWWVLVALLAVLDWYAVAAARTGVERVAKPATMLALGGAAVSMGAIDARGGWWLLVALALGLAGDVLLLADSRPRFVGGLAAFLVGHLGYVACFVTLGLSHPEWGAAGAVSVVVALVLGRAILPGAFREGGPALAGPVAAYMGVIGAMVVAAWSTGRPLLALGSAVFLASDTLLASDLFGTSRRWAKPVVMVTYHVGQALIVVGVLHT